MKHLFLTLTMLLASIAASAQTPVDTIGVFSLRNDSLVRIQPQAYDNVTTALRFQDPTSQHHFSRAATLRIYLGEPSLAMSASYQMFVINKEITDFGIAQMTPHKTYRTMKFTKCKWPFSKVKDGVYQTFRTSVTVTKVRTNVYDITFFAAPGEYCVTVAAKHSESNAIVFPFTIDENEAYHKSIKKKYDVWTK